MPARFIKLGEVILHNKGLKLLSLLMAAISWYVIQDAISFEVEIPDLRLQIQVQDGMAILNQSASTVDVTFRGSQEDIQRLDPRRLQAVVDMTQTEEVSKEVALTPGMIRGVRGARAVAVHPARIHVTLDRQAEKRVPVKGRTVGSPLFGEVDAVICDPSTVLLRGSAAKLRTTDCVYTQPVDVDGRVESFVRRSTLQAPGDNWVAQMDPSDVQVKVNLTRRNATLERKGVAVNAIMDPGRTLGIDIEPPTVDIVLMGRAPGVPTTEEGRLVRALVDCVGLVAPGEFVVPVRVLAGADFSAVTRPETVRVVVTQK
jgi:YbbR domain-containing protein